MATDKFYVIKNNVVQNVIICEESYAEQNKLIKCPVVTPYGIADINWTFVDNTFLPPPRDILKEWEDVRAIRNALLADSDIFVAPDRWATYANEKQQEWSHYRQQLRDVPQNYVDPKEIIWPTKPE